MAMRRIAKIGAELRTAGANRDVKNSESVLFLATSGEARRAPLSHSSCSGASRNARLLPHSIEQVRQPAHLFLQRVNALRAAGVRAVGGRHATRRAEHDRQLDRRFCFFHETRQPGAMTLPSQSGVMSNVVVDTALPCRTEGESAGVGLVPPNLCGGFATSQVTRAGIEPATL